MDKEGFIRQEQQLCSFHDCRDSLIYNLVSEPPQVGALDRCLSVIPILGFDFNEIDEQTESQAE